MRAERVTRSTAIRRPRWPAALAKLPSCTPSNRTDARAWSPGTAPSSAHKSEAAGRRSWPSAPAFLECNLPLSALPAENPLAWRTLGEKRLAADAVEPHPDMLPVTRTRTGGEKLFRGRGGVMDASLKNRGGLRRPALSIQRTPTALPAKQRLADLAALSLIVADSIRRNEEKERDARTPRAVPNYAVGTAACPGARAMEGRMGLCQRAGMSPDRLGPLCVAAAW
jgi:hypothetical protein